MRFRGLNSHLKKSLFLLVIASQFIPAAVVVLPYFLMFKTYGLLDTKIALVLVNLSIVLPYAVWMIKGFLDAVPVEIEESALVDGAPRWRVLAEIMVPAAWPGIITAAVFSFTLTWNEFLFGLILSKQDAVTLPIGLIGFRTERGDLWELMASGGLMITLPMFLLSMLVQKHFVGSLHGRLRSLTNKPSMTTIDLRHVHKRFGSTAVVKDLNLSIADREFLVLLGPSGCGKTTTMRMIAGLEEASEGDLLFDGQRINDLPTQKRDVAMVFQNYGLYPHMSVFDNIAYPLKLQGISH